MGYGNSGYPQDGGEIDLIVSDQSKRGAETSVQEGSDTDIFVFQMGSSVSVGGDIDPSASHTVATSVQVDTV